MHEIKVGLVGHWRGPSYLARCTCGWAGFEQPSITLAVHEHEAHVVEFEDVVAEAERIAQEAAA